MSKCYVALISSKALMQMLFLDIFKSKKCQKYIFVFKFFYG